jgi:hypothetical protein
LSILSEVWLLNFLRSTHSYRRLTHLFIPSMNSKWCKENVAEPPIKMAGKSMGSNPTTITHWNLLIKRSSSWWITLMFLCELRCLDLKSLYCLCRTHVLLMKSWVGNSYWNQQFSWRGLATAPNSQIPSPNAVFPTLEGSEELGDFTWTINTGILFHEISRGLIGFNYYDFMGCIWIHDS